MSSKKEKSKATKNNIKKLKGQTKLRLVKNGDMPAEKEISKPAKAGKSASGSKKKSKKTESKKSPAAMYEDKPRLGDWFIQHRSLVVIATSIVAVLAVLGAIYYFFVKTYTVTTVYVDGNVHYSNEEVMGMVMTGYYGNNSLYLALKYKDKGIEGIPFVEKMDVTVLTPDTIRINVYEKAMAGYIEYLGRYIYFDKDGIAVESSDVRTKGIPQVTGLTFGYVVLHEPLPVEDEEIFKNILSITQLLGKYQLSADKIYFDSGGDLTLYFKEVKVSLGSNSDLDEKMMRLQYILPELEGKNGTLSMENFTDDTKNITFHQDTSAK